MIRAAFLTLLLLAAADAGAFDRLGVIAVADPPAGPDADLAELAHQIRAACRDRIGGVDDVPTMRARLLGQMSNATLSELDRAYGGALAVFQNGEFESALRTLHAIVEDLESLPETDDSYSQWVRAQMRLAHAALTIARESEADVALYAVAKTDISITPDPEQFSPSYRRRYEGIKAKVRALPVRRLTVTSEGSSGTVFVNGRPMGTTPLILRLPAGTYRIGGQAGDLRVPSFAVDVRAEDRSVVLDFGLAESLRVNAGPGLALPQARRGDGIVRAGAWLVVDKLIAVSRAYEGEAAFLLGSMYDVRRGALLREGSVRMVAGSVPAANLGALAAFLLTGQSSRDVKDRTDPSRAGVPVAAAPAPAAASRPSAPPAPAPAAAPPPQPVIPPVVMDPKVAPEPSPPATPPPAPKANAPKKTLASASSLRPQAAAPAAPPAPKAELPPAAATPAPVPSPTTKPSLAVLPPS
ncbi:MAG TPA: PEGA domain-containing protein, partial [Gaiellaceae bacterium]